MELTQNIVNAMVAVAIVAGAIKCFFGYPLFMFLLGLVGFIAGAALCGVLGFAMSQQEMIALIAGVIGGLIGAGLVVAFYLIGIFLIGALLGGVLAAAIGASGGGDPNLVVVLIAALVGGFLAVSIQQFMIIVVTAFGGSAMMVYGIGYFTFDLPPVTELEPLLRAVTGHLFILGLVWLLLGLFGMVVQYRISAAGDSNG
jgi:hypothetical protein